MCIRDRASGVLETAYLDRVVIRSNPEGKNSTSSSYSLEDVIEEKTFVIEAVVERFDVKLEIFNQISKLMNEEVVMATNSSFIQASEISKHCEHPERFINMHFFYPPIRMDLIEISYPSNVSKEVLERTKTVSEKMADQWLYSKRKPLDLL